MIFDPKALGALFEQFDSMKVLVIGDVMIDAYLWGKVDRISPEAPVPVVEVNRNESRMGGAANVALNLMSLGAEPIICSAIGEDPKGDLFLDLMEKRSFSTDGIIRSEHRSTTCKTRIISGGQQILRVDEEMTNDLDVRIEKLLIRKIGDHIDSGEVDVIIFEDYNKGVLTANVIRSVIKKASEAGVPTCVDPKKANFFEYKGCTLFKPNLKEIKEGIKQDFDVENPEQLLNAVVEMEEQIDNEYSLVTLSEHGVFVKHVDHFETIPAHRREILDVSGAGDTVISVAALALAAKCNASQIAALSNLAGGQVCERVGVVPVSRTQLLHEAAEL